MRLDLVNIFPVKLDLKPFIHLESGSFQFTFERNAWQKQEVLKGVDPYLARLDGGWGFHQFQDSTASGMSTVWRPYTPAEANAMIADGSIVTNAVFERSASAMFSPTNTPAETYEVIAYNIPAVSYAAGSVATLQGDFNRDLNTDEFRNGWSRNSISYGQDWLHSDMKDMAYFHVFPLYREITRKIQGGQ